MVERLGREFFREHGGYRTSHDGSSYTGKATKELAEVHLIEQLETIEGVPGLQVIDPGHVGCDDLREAACGDHRKPQTGLDLSLLDQT